MGVSVSTMLRQIQGEKVKEIKVYNNKYMIQWQKDNTNKYQQAFNFL